MHDPRIFRYLARGVLGIFLICFVSVLERLNSNFKFPIRLLPRFRVLQQCNKKVRCRCVFETHSITLIDHD